MITRTELINHLIKKHRLSRYLEIGVQNPWQNFEKIECHYKVGVDPDPNAHATFCMTSDQYFSQNWQQFDLIFIDGLHTAEQVRKDFHNAIRAVAPAGFIVMHDCNPEKEEHTIVPRPTKTGHWNGDVFKAAMAIAAGWPDNFKTVDIDNGCGVWQEGSMGTWCSKNTTWTQFARARRESINLVTWDEFVQ